MCGKLSSVREKEEVGNTNQFYSEYKSNASLMVEERDATDLHADDNRVYECVCDKRTEDMQLNSLCGYRYVVTYAKREYATD